MTVPESFDGSVFYTKIAIAGMLFGIDLFFGIIPVFIQFRLNRLSRIVSWINCFCGGFLLGSVLLQMLFEATNLLEESLGHFPNSFLIFGLGYVFIMFFEKWIHVLTVEYRHLSHGDFGDGEWILQNKQELIKANNTTAYILAVSCIVETFISAIAIGTQIDQSSLWTVGMMLVSTEWIQMFIFVFQFRQCKVGLSMGHASTLLEMNSQNLTNQIIIKQEDDDGDGGSNRGRLSDKTQRKIQIETIVNVFLISFTNIIGVFLGNLISQFLGSIDNNNDGGSSKSPTTTTTNIQNICAGVLLAFIAGIFMHIATSQMIVKEFEATSPTESELLKKASLIILGLVLSSVSNILMNEFL